MARECTRCAICRAWGHQKETCPKDALRRQFPPLTSTNNISTAPLIDGQPLDKTGGDTAKNGSTGSIRAGQLKPQEQTVSEPLSGNLDHVQSSFENTVSARTERLPGGIGQERDSATAGHSSGREQFGENANNESTGSTRAERLQLPEQIVGEPLPGIIDQTQTRIENTVAVTEQPSGDIGHVRDPTIAGHSSGQTRAENVNSKSTGSIRAEQSIKQKDGSMRAEQTLEEKEQDKYSVSNNNSPVQRQSPDIAHVSELDQYETDESLSRSMDLPTDGQISSSEKEQIRRAIIEHEESLSNEVIILDKRYEKAENTRQPKSRSPQKKDKTYIDDTLCDLCKKINDECVCSTEEKYAMYVQKVCEGIVEQEKKQKLSSGDDQTKSNTPPKNAQSPPKRPNSVQDRIKLLEKETTSTQNKPKTQREPRGRRGKLISPEKKQWKH